MTLEQARAVAEELRHHRDALIHEIATGDLSPSMVARDRRAPAVKAVVIAEAVPGVGKVGARRILASLGIAASTRWGDLTPGQRAQLAESLTAAGAPPAAAP